MLTREPGNKHQPRRQPQQAERSGDDEHRLPACLDQKSRYDRCGDHPSKRNAGIHDANTRRPMVDRKPFGNRFDGRRDQRGLPSAQ